MWSEIAGFYMTKLNYKTIDPPEILLSQCIRAAENYYSKKFHFKWVLGFCDRLGLEFLSF